MIGKRKDDDNDGTGLFERSRRPLEGLAYRILGSRSDAEDAVQDTFLKWQAAEQGAIDNPAAWLTTICTRRCLDMLRAAHRTRPSRPEAAILAKLKNVVGTRRLWLTADLAGNDAPLR